MKVLPRKAEKLSISIWLADSFPLGNEPWLHILWNGFVLTVIANGPGIC